MSVEEVSNIEDVVDSKLIKIFEQAKFELETAISKLSFSGILFYIPLINMKYIPNMSIKTIGVGVINNFDLVLYYNPVFFINQTNIQKIAILKHESLHILLQHLSRVADSSSNGRLYNIAADIAINQEIKDLPDWVYTHEKQNLPPGESSEFYYKELKSRNDDACSELMASLDSADFIDKYIDSLDGDMLDDHSFWEKLNDQQREILSEKISSIVEEAVRAQDSVGWGKVGHRLHDAIVAANAPVLNWKRELKYFYSKSISFGRKNTIMRHNRRYGSLYPGRRREYGADILIAIDTSASVNDSQVHAFISELPGMLNNASIDVICFDVECIGSPAEFKSKNTVVKINGRGGTNFAPPIALADSLKYDGIIMMTDGECSFPPQPKCNVLWVICGNRKITPPYGKVIQLPQ
jgi:predicted metal-dependent peptidase